MFNPVLRLGKPFFQKAIFDFYFFPLDMEAAGRIGGKQLDRFCLSAEKVVNRAKNRDYA